jgi:hypothetical protein
MELLKTLRKENKKFDLVFIDADKKAYKSYLLTLMGAEESEERSNSENVRINRNNCLLNDGALVLLDNTLWKGLVLAEDTELSQFCPPAENYGKPERMQKMASFMHEFNEFVSKLSRDGVIVRVNRDESQWMEGVSDVLQHVSGVFKNSKEVVSATATCKPDLESSGSIEMPIQHLTILPLRDGLTLIRFADKSRTSFVKESK